MEVLTDFAAYPSFLPEIEEVEVVTSGQASWEVRFVAQVIRRLEYTLRLERADDRELSWTLVSGLFASNDGCWELEAAGDEGQPCTRTSYTIDLVLGLFVPQALVNSLVGESLPATLERFKQRVEAGAEPAPAGAAGARDPAGS